MAKPKTYDDLIVDFMKKRVDNPKPSNQPTSNKDNPPIEKKPIFDSRAGKLIGFEYPDGSVDLGKGNISNKPVPEKYSNPQAAKQKAADETAQVTEISTLLNQLNAPITPKTDTSELLKNPNAAAVLKTAGERAAVAAAGGAVTGAIGGSVVPGVGTLAGAGILGVGAGIVGGISGLFSEYKKKDQANFNIAAGNYDKAIENMNQAIALANKGAGFEANQLAVKNYRKAKAQILLSKSELKLLSKDQNAYINDIREKLTDIEDYEQNDEARLDFLMATALQRPTLSYVNEGGMQNG